MFLQSISATNQVREYDKTKMSEQKRLQCRSGTWTWAITDKKKPSLQRSGIYLYAIGNDPNEVVTLTQHVFTSPLLCSMTVGNGKKTAKVKDKNPSFWSLHSSKLRKKKNNKTNKILCYLLCYRVMRAKEKHKARKEIGS